MTPEERTRMEKLEQLVDSLYQVKNVPFIENFKLRVVNEAVDTRISQTNLSALADVEGTDSATTGQVLKKTATTWQPGTDNIA